jgi:hypothetical protein
MRQYNSGEWSFSKRGEWLLENLQETLLEMQARIDNLTAMYDKQFERASKAEAEAERLRELIADQ